MVALFGRLLLATGAGLGVQFFPSKPRGKFAGKPIPYPEMLSRRRYFVPLYVLIWAGVIVSFVSAFVTLGAA